MVFFSKAMVTPGTAVALASSSKLIRRLWIQAKRVAGGNTTPIFVGDDTVDYVSKQGIQLGANEVLALEFAAPVNLASIFIDGATATDGVVGFYQE